MRRFAHPDPMRWVSPPFLTPPCAGKLSETHGASGRRASRIWGEGHLPQVCLNWRLRKGGEGPPLWATECLWGLTSWNVTYHFDSAAHSGWARRTGCGNSVPRQRPRPSHTSRSQLSLLEGPAAGPCGSESFFSEFTPQRKWLLLYSLSVPREASPHERLDPAVFWGP